MTYRERRLAKAERLRGWADKRSANAASVFKSHERYRGDHAFNTQPGHIPERARVIAREDRAFESLQKAGSMSSKAAGIEAAADRAIYSDDEDATERLGERIAELEGERDRMKRANKDFKKGAKIEALDYLTERDKRLLLSVAQTQPYYMKDGLRFPPYAISNLTGNIGRQKKRLAALSQPVAPRLIYVRYDGECVKCDATIEKGETAAYDKAERELTCRKCVDAA